MWVITHYKKRSIQMYEFLTKEEANEHMKQVSGCKVLSQVIYYNDEKPLLGKGRE